MFVTQQYNDWTNPAVTWQKSFVLLTFYQVFYLE